MLKIRYKDNCEETAHYWRAYWAGEVLDRPLVCMSCAGEDTKAYWADTSYRRKNMLRTDEDIIALLADFEKQAAGRKWLGESVPLLPYDLGADMYAAFFGAHLCVSEDPRVDTAWVQPLVKDDGWDSFTPQILHGPDSIYDRYMHMLSVAREYAAGKFLISAPDCHSNMDAISALRGPQNICYDLIDCPDDVMRALRGVQQYYGAFWHDVRETAGFGQTGQSGWIPAYCDEDFAVVQCDFLALIGTEHGRKFVYPELEKEIACHRHVIYHLDGPDCLKHLDAILGMKGVDAIQWVPGDGQPRSLEWMEVLHKIQAAGKGLWIYDWSPEEIKKHFKELRPEKLFFSTGVSSEQEADELLKYMKMHM